MAEWPTSWPTKEQIHWTVRQIAFGSDSIDMSADAIDALYAPLRDEVERLRQMTSVSLGVGDGLGQLFVHGDYDSIKECQSKLLERGTLREEHARLQGDMQAMILTLAKLSREHARLLAAMTPEQRAAILGEPEAPRD